MTEQPQKLVILVEDEDDIARLIVHHVERGGFRIHCPERVSDLIADAERLRPSLFILDLMLPEMDGFELCRTVKAHPVLHETPILVLTARTAAEDRKRALESGAEQYMTKPFRPLVLLEAVRELSGREF